MNNIDTAIKLGYHRMTGYEMSRDCRLRLDAQPTCSFTGLARGWYQYKAYALAESCRIVVVERLTKSGRQADVLYPHVDGTIAERGRIHAGSWTGLFTALDETLEDLLGVTHRNVVSEAVSRGLDACTCGAAGCGRHCPGIPARVRIEHPQLFAEIPERFAQPDRSLSKTAAEHVRDLLKSVRASDPVTPATVDLWIDEAHRQSRRWREEAVRRIALNPFVAVDYDQFERDLDNAIDVYRWLRPYVDVGGAFYVPQEDQP